MQMALLGVYLLHEGNRKKHEEEEKNGGQGRDPNEFNARY